MADDTSVLEQNRRSFLKAAGATGVLGLAGCSGEDGGDGGAGDGTDGETDGGSTDEEMEPVTFLLNPAEDSVDIELQYQPFANYIEEEVGVEIETTQTADYAATFTELESGRGDLADTSPSAIVATENFAEPLGLRVAFGAEKYFSLITTPMDSDVETLQDLEGEEVAFGSTLSVSGGLVPSLMMKEAGFDIGDIPSGDAEDFTATFTGDHFTAVDSAANSPRVAAAASGAFAVASRVPREQFDEMSEEFVDISAEYGNTPTDPSEADMNLLSVSEPIPRAPIMVRSDWDHPEREAIETAILEAPDEAFQWEEEALAEELGVDPDTEEGEDAISNHQIWFDDVVPADDSDYDYIRTVLDELGLEFEDITG